jgi:hypothetical protein
VFRVPVCEVCSSAVFSVQCAVFRVTVCSLQCAVCEYVVKRYTSAQAAYGSGVRSVQGVCESVCSLQCSQCAN